MAEPEPVLASTTPASAGAASENGAKKTVWEKQWKTHSVKRGESLGGIADKYNVTLAEIKKWNKIKGSKIIPGQKIKIQTNVKKTIIVSQEENNVAQNNSEPTPQQEEERDGEVVEETAESAPVAETPKSTKQPAQPKYKYYTIQPGDTLWKIANKHEGVSMEQIKKLNSGLKENKLSVGQKIKIKQIG